jgi:hypothetical protein
MSGVKHHNNCCFPHQDRYHRADTQERCCISVLSITDAGSGTLLRLGNNSRRAVPLRSLWHKAPNCDQSNKVDGSAQ